MKISKTSPKLHFGVSKKDPGLVFHYHVLILFKSWSNLGFDQVWNEHEKFKKNWKNKKPARMAFLCHILTIAVDKHGINTLSQKNHACDVISQKSVVWSRGWREGVFISFMKWLNIGQGHYISALDANPRVWGHLEKVEKMVKLEMGLFGLPLGLLFSSFWTILNSWKFKILENFKYLENFKL